MSEINRLMEEISAEWDGCMCESIGCEIDIGAALRKSFKRVSAITAALKQEDALDAKRLDWLMRRVSESAFRDIGIVWPAWSPQSRRAAIDAAMKEPNA
jgi:hypothetical protein